MLHRSRIIVAPWRGANRVHGLLDGLHGLSRREKRQSDSSLGVSTMLLLIHVLRRRWGRARPPFAVSQRRR
jgi:hypothetical protein